MNARIVHSGAEFSYACWFGQDDDCVDDECDCDCHIGDDDE